MAARSLVYSADHLDVISNFEHGKAAADDFRDLHALRWNPPNRLQRYLRMRLTKKKKKGGKESRYRQGIIRPASHYCVKLVWFNRPRVFRGFTKLVVRLSRHSIVLELLTE